MLAIQKHLIVEVAQFSMTAIQECADFLDETLEGVIVTDDSAYLIFKSDDNTVLSEILDGVMINNCLQVNDGDMIIKAQSGKVYVMSPQDFSEHYTTIARSASYEN